MSETSNAGFWAKLTWEGAVATIALLQPWGVGLWRRFFRAPAVDLHETGVVEVGYSTYGPTLGLHGTLRARHADVFVRAMRLEVVRERDQARHFFEWVAFRSHRIFVGKATETMVELPAGFMLLTSQPFRYNVLFADAEVRERVNAELRTLGQAWYEAVLEGRDYDAFRTETSHGDAFTKVDRECYWERGGYILRATVETTRPDQRHESVWRFELTEEDAESLRTNVVPILRETCWQQDVYYSFASPKYLSAKAGLKGGAKS